MAEGTLRGLQMPDWLQQKRLLQVIERNAAAYERLAVTIENLSALIGRSSPHGS